MYTVGAVITLSLPTVARQYAQATALSHGGIRGIGSHRRARGRDAVVDRRLATVATSVGPEVP